MEEQTNNTQNGHPATSPPLAWTVSDVRVESSGQGTELWFDPLADLPADLVLGPNDRIRFQVQDGRIVVTYTGGETAAATSDQDARTASEPAADTDSAAGSA